MLLKLLYVIGIFFARNLSIRKAYGVAEASARFYYKFAERDKRELKANLKVVLGENVPDDVLERHRIEIFKNFAKYLVDFFRFPNLTKEYLEEHIDTENIDCINKCLEEKKGVILLTLHLGNWELAGAVIANAVGPVNAIVLEHSSKTINNFFIHQRAIRGVKSIPLGVQIKECFKVLKRNEPLAIVGDKDYTDSGTSIDFFGKKALVPKGPAAFALRTGAPVIFTVLTREKNDRFKLHFEEPLRYSPTGDFEKDVKCLMSKYLESFEKYIRKYPDQWYVFREIWNQK